MASNEQILDPETHKTIIGVSDVPELEEGSIDTQPEVTFDEEEPEVNFDEGNEQIGVPELEEEVLDTQSEAEEDLFDLIFENERPNSSFPANGFDGSGTHRSYSGSTPPLNFKPKMTTKNDNEGWFSRQKTYRQ